MKSPTDIKDKIRQIKYEYLKQSFKERLARAPENCGYNKQMILHDTKEYKTRVCTYFSGTEHYQVCNTVKCAQQCNAFVAKYPKEDLRDRLEADIEKNPNKYPEVIALNWVLEKMEADPEKLPMPDVEPEALLTEGTDRRSFFMQLGKDFIKLFSYVTRLWK